MLVAICYIHFPPLPSPPPFFHLDLIAHRFCSLPLLPSHPCTATPPHKSRDDFHVAGLCFSPLSQYPQTLASFISSRLSSISSLSDHLSGSHCTARAFRSILLISFYGSYFLLWEEWHNNGPDTPNRRLFFHYSFFGLTVLFFFSRVTQIKGSFIFLSLHGKNQVPLQVIAETHGNTTTLRPFSTCRTCRCPWKATCCAFRLIAQPQVHSYCSVANTTRKYDPRIFWFPQIEFNIYWLASSTVYFNHDKTKSFGHTISRNGGEEQNTMTVPSPRGGRQKGFGRQGVVAPLGPTPHFITERKAICIYLRAVTYVLWVTRTKMSITI